MTNRGLKDTLLGRLRFLLRGLREPGPSEEAEGRELEAFKRELEAGWRPERRRVGRPQPGC